MHSINLLTADHWTSQIFIFKRKIVGGCASKLQSTGCQIFSTLQTKTTHNSRIISYDCVYAINLQII
jgi:hypothetical protein